MFTLLSVGASEYFKTILALINLIQVSVWLLAQLLAIAVTYLSVYQCIIYMV